MSNVGLGKGPGRSRALFDPCLLCPGPTSQDKTPARFADHVSSIFIRAVGHSPREVSSTVLAQTPEGLLLRVWQSATPDQDQFMAHSVPLCVLGTFFLWFGWCPRRDPLPGC